MPMYYVVMHAKAISKMGHSLDGHANSEMTKLQMILSQGGMLSNHTTNQIYCL